MSKISVIIPVYNSEAYLNKCVDSILYQTISDIEIILIDDGSTDRSSQICDKYAKIDNRIKVFHNENIGLVESRKFGINIATSEYIFFLDSDDYIPQNALSKLQEAATDTNADIVKGAMAIMDETGFQTNKWCYNLTSKATISGKDFIYNMIAKYFWCLAGTLIKKELFYNITYPNISIGEDLIFMLQLAIRSAKVSYIDETVYCYIRHNSSMTNADNSINKVSYDKLNIAISLQHLVNSQPLDNKTKIIITLLLIDHYNDVIPNVIKNINNKDKTILQKFIIFKFIINIPLHIRFIFSKSLRAYCHHYSRRDYIVMIFKAIKKTML